MKLQCAHHIPLPAEAFWEVIHSPRYEDKNNSVFGSFTHTLSDKAFYDASVNWFTTSRFRVGPLGAISRRGAVPNRSMSCCTLL